MTSSDTLVDLVINELTKRQYDTLSSQNMLCADQLYLITDQEDYATKSEVPTKVSQLQNDAGYTSNVGTITGITMNNSSKGTSGNVNLGTVLTATSTTGSGNAVTDITYSNGQVIATKDSTFLSDDGKFIKTDSDLTSINNNQIANYTLTANCYSKSEISTFTLSGEYVDAIGGTFSYQVMFLK